MEELNCPKWESIKSLINDEINPKLYGLIKTRRKVLKVAKIKDANYGCKDEGNDDGVSGQSVNRQTDGHLYF